MNFADSLKPRISRIRDIPALISIRPFRVFIVKSKRDGNYSLEGNKTETHFELLNYAKQPKVRQISPENIALLNLENNALEVGPVTTNETIESILGTEKESQIRFLVVYQGKEFFYRLNSVKRDRALHYMFVISPMSGEV